MSQSLSTVLERLSYTGPNLAVGGTYTTIKRQILEFASLNISFSSDVDFSITVYFSDDGDNFDVVIPLNYIAATSNGSLSTPCLGAWVQIKIENVGTGTSTHVRMYVYGSITNSVTTAVFQTGSGTPHVIVDSGNINVNGTTADLSGYQSVVKLIPYQDFQLNMRNMQQLSKSLFSAVPNLYSGIRPLLNYQVIDSAISYFSTDGNVLGLRGFDVSSISDANKFARFFSNTVLPVIVDKTTVVSFTTLFLDTAPTSSTYYSKEQVGLGLTTSDTNVTKWYTGYSIGTANPVFWGGVYTKFRISSWKDGVETFVSQNNFNLDVLNGTGASGMTLDTTKFNNYLIKIKLGGTTQVIFSVFNSSTSSYVDFHKIVESNVNTSVGNILACKMIVESSNKINTSTPADTAGSLTSSFCGYIESGIYINPGWPISFNNNSSVATTETQLVLLYNDESFHGYRASIPLVLSDISISSDASSSSMIIRIYKNPIITAAGYNSVNDSYSPLLYDNSFTVSDVGIVVGSYSVGAGGWLSHKLKGILLNPGEAIMVTGQLNSGSSSNCNLGLTFLQYM